MPNNAVMMEEAQLLPRCVPLGTTPAVAEVAVSENSDAERLNVLEERMLDITNTLDNIASVVKILLNKVEPQYPQQQSQHVLNTKNKKVSDIPNDTILIGKTKGITYYLHIYDGDFYVGNTKYESLSAAAKGVSGTRRSGFVFWEFPDGKTVKDFLNE